MFTNLYVRLLQLTAKKMVDKFLPPSFDSETREYCSVIVLDFSILKCIGSQYFSMPVMSKLDELICLKISRWQAKDWPS